MRAASEATLVSGPIFVHTGLVYFSTTRCSVGTTTMRFGAARYGPAAPVTRQWCECDTFTSTGVPTLSTEKEMDRSSSATSETVTGGLAVRASKISGPSSTRYGASPRRS